MKIGGQNPALLLVAGVLGYIGALLLHVFTDSSDWYREGVILKAAGSLVESLDAAPPFLRIKSTIHSHPEGTPSCEVRGCEPSGWKYNYYTEATSPPKGVAFLILEENVRLEFISLVLLPPIILLAPCSLRRRFGLLLIGLVILTIGHICFVLAFGYVDGAMRAALTAKEKISDFHRISHSLFKPIHGIQGQLMAIIIGLGLTLRIWLRAAHAWIDPEGAQALEEARVIEAERRARAAEPPPPTPRGAPCPCGSGRKFKHCCGFASDAKGQAVAS